jgi:Ion channel
LAGEAGEDRNADSGYVKARASGDAYGNHFGFLLIVLVTVYVLSAFVSATWVKAVQVLLYLTAALLAVRTARVPRRNALLAFTVTVGGSAAALVLVLTYSSGPGAGTGYLLMAVALAVAAVLVLYRVLATQQEVTLQSIFGAISVYMILGFMFAVLYAAINEFGHGDFFAAGEPASMKTFQYFSFVTLTTVGYGDFTAATSGGRAVAVLEAVTGQVFLATLVARLVSAYRGPQRPGDEDRTGQH